VTAGLEKLTADAGMLVALSNNLGQTVLDGPEATISPFTRALISHTAQPGVEIQQAMTEVRTQLSEETNKNQIAWQEANLEGPVFLNQFPASPGTGMIAASSPSRLHHACKSREAQEDEKVEKMLWRSVEDTEDAQDLKAYLKTYPKGQFSSLALGKLASFDQPKPIPLVLRFDSYTMNKFSRDRTDEDKIGLNRLQRRDVQRQLTTLGFDVRITGEFDHNTRWEIKRWQATRGYPVSGYLNAIQHEDLSIENAPLVRDIKR